MRLVLVGTGWAELCRNSVNTFGNWVPRTSEGHQGYLSEKELFIGDVPVEEIRMEKTSFSPPLFD